MKEPSVYALYCVLENTPDPQTLLSLATTCRTLYQLFKEREHTLVMSVLHRHLPWHVLREVTFVERCRPRFFDLDALVETKPSSYEWETATNVAWQTAEIGRASCRERV